MKKIFFATALFGTFAFMACNGSLKSKDDNAISTDVINIPSDDKADTNKKMAKFDFDNIVYDFGQISQGEKVHTSFKFKNTGDADLLITDAKGSCGCTVPIYPENPIKPGETGEIEVVFDSNGKMGKQNKTVTLVANTQPNTTVLALKGEVLTPNK